MTSAETEPEVEVEPEPVEPEPVEEPVEVEPEPSEEPVEEPEASAEPEARAPTAAELRAFERENTRHEKKLAEIVGPDWQHFAPCETCGGVGFAPAAIAQAPELQASPGLIECPSCKGYGRLTTPSRVPGQETQVCVDCAGNGWKREAAQPLAAPATYAPPLPGQPNGAPGAPPGYILVQVDPNAPPLPPAPEPQAVPASSAA